MEIPEVVRNNLAVSIVSLLVGALIAAIATKLHAKSARLRYSTRVDRLALAADDPVLGSVRITWANQPVRNLYMATVEIENASNHDFENVDFRVYTAPETNLLNERTFVVDTPYIVRWSPEFHASIAVGAGLLPTLAQMEIYYHSREYRVPVFNRGQLLRFDYLCTRPNDDVQPGVVVCTQLKGAKLRYQFRSNLVFGVPMQLAVVRGLIISVLAVIVCGSRFQSVWVASGVSTIVGLSAQLLGAAEYKAERWLWKLIAG